MKNNILVFAILLMLPTFFTSCKEEDKAEQFEERLEERSDDMEDRADDLEDRSDDFEEASDHIGEASMELEEAMDNFREAVEEVDNPEDREAIRQRINGILDSLEINSLD